MGGEKAIAPQPGDRRFAHPAWQQRPYDLLIQAVLLGEEWWDSVVRSPGGVGRHNERIVAFTVRQWLDLMSPSNVPWLNPEVIEATRATGGVNLITGIELIQYTASREARDSSEVRDKPRRQMGVKCMYFDIWAMQNEWLITG